MKIIAIGDIHAKTIWEKIVEKEQDADKILFVGDYFDNLEGISYPDQIDNFKKILKLKENDPDKYILLCGNHDLHYLNSIQEQYSGFNPTFKFDISEVLFPAIRDRLVQAIYWNSGFLFSHAGLSKTWVRETLGFDFEPGIPLNTLIIPINDFLKYQPQVFGFNGYNPYGDDITQGPLWIRPESLKKDAIEGVTHVVGHTQQPKMRIEPGFCFIDTLDRSKEYLSITTDGMNSSLGPKEI